MPLSGTAVAILAVTVGVPHDQLVTCVAIAWAESGLNPDATGHNGPTAGCPSGSTDRGLWQINNCYHPGYGDSCAYDPVCNAKAMFAISNRGTNWHPWSTYGNGAYLRYVGAAQAAVAGVTLTPSAPQPSSGGFNPIEYAVGLARSGANPWDTLVRTLQQVFVNIQSQI